MKMQVKHILRRAIWSSALLFSLSANGQPPAALAVAMYVPAAGGGGGITVSDPDAQAYINDIIAQGGSPTQTQADYFNDFIIALKGHSLWTKIYGLGFTAWGDANANKVNMKTLTPYVTFNGGTHGSSGYVGNGSSAYADLGIDPTIGAQNSFSIGVYITEVSSINTSTYIGSRVNSPFGLTGISRGGSASSLFQVKRSSSTYSSLGTGAPFGFTLATRTSSVNPELYKAGSSLGIGSDASTNVNNANIYLHALNQNGTAAQFSNGTISLWVVADGLNSTEVANFFTDVEALMDDLGIGVQ